MAHAPETAFRRVVGRWSIVALALNDVVGSGVYLLPAAAVALLGPWSLLAVLAAAVAVALVVLTFAEAATYFDEPGSAYLYTRTAFGDFAGFQVGWMAWLTRVVAIASLSAGFAQAVAYLWPAAVGGWPRAFTVSVPLLALTWINVRGVRGGVLTSVVLVIGKLVPLGVFVLVGAWVATRTGSWGMIALQEPTTTVEGLRRWGEASLLLLYAFAGFENTAAAAGEFRRPRRDVPFALVVHLAVVATLYLLVQAVVMALLPNAAASTTPLADASRTFLGQGGGLLLTVGAVVSILGTKANSVFAAPRYLFALAADGFGPAVLGRLHPRARTPHVALVATTAIAWPLALEGTFVGLAALSVVARLITYVGTAAAVPVLRRRSTAPEGAFRLPFGPTIPVAAIVLSLVFAASATPRHLMQAGVAILVGAIVYGLRRRPRQVGDAEV